MSKSRQIGVPRLEPELLNHVRVEFREHGIRAAGFLEAAWQLLDAQQAPAPKLGELVVYCIREALTEIPKASGILDQHRWKDLSRKVVESARRYRMAAKIPDEGSADTLGELLASVDALDEFHKEGGVHKGRLLSLMIQRAGVEPLLSGTTPIHEYQRLLNRLNGALHTSCTVDGARGLWLETVALLRQLFLPPEVRNRELDKIALRSDPSESDMTDVLDLAGTSIHLRRFLEKIESPRWLWLFEASGALNSGTGDLWWSACLAAVRLAPTYGDEALSWLSEMHDKHTNELERIRPIAHAAYQLGGSALRILLEIVRRYPEDDRVVLTGRKAVLELEVSDRMVEDLADVLLNENSWYTMILPEDIVSHIVVGVNEHNACDRIELLSFKLNTVPEDDLVLFDFRYDRCGRIANGPVQFRDDRSSVLLNALTEAVRAAREGVLAAELLDATGGLSDLLQARMRAWILARSPYAAPDTIAAELERAMASRKSTGDDIALIDRAVQVCDRIVLKDICRVALGNAPSVRHVSLALRSDQPPPDPWMRARTWVALLPADLAESWIGPCQVLAGKFGELRRNDLLSNRRVEAAWAESPISVTDLKLLSPEEAAQRIAGWRPAPTDWLGGARELARTLNTLVKEDPEGWVSEPVSIATKLRHPIYISHYLQALAKLAAEVVLPVAGLLDVIQMALAEPWSAVSLGHDSVDHDWYQAQRYAVDLIGQLARADADFGDRADEAWDVINTVARDISQPTWGSQEKDPLHRAINRRCTLAFDAARLFVTAEMRASQPPRPGFENLLTFGLRLEGNDGSEYRAILAPRIGWLCHSLPEWTEANAEYLFGGEAPEGLAQLTVDLAIQWGQPNRWLLATYPEMIRDAAGRQVKRALLHIFIGMLWGLPDYEIESVVHFLETHPHLTSSAGITLSSLIRDSQTDPRFTDIAVDLWRVLLESEVSFLLASFGWMYRAASLPTDLWADLTLETLGKLDRTDVDTPWVHEVAKRAMSTPVTVTKLALLDRLIRRERSDHWALRHIADNIQGFLATASSLASTDEYQRLRTALLERGMIDE